MATNGRIWRGLRLTLEQELTSALRGFLCRLPSFGAGARYSMLQVVHRRPEAPHCATMIHQCVETNRCNLEPCRFSRSCWQHY